MSSEDAQEPKKLGLGTIEEAEAKKPINKLRELRKQYPEVTNVQINNDIISKILNKIKNAINFGQRMDGLLFGRETEKAIIISTLIPCNITELTQNTLNNFNTYLETSRLDNTKIGFYFCDDGDELLSQNKLKTFIEFQKSFPNSVILFIDINAVKVNTYPFKCFRISDKIMEKIEEEEILQNVYLSKENIIREFYKQMFNKINPTIELIQPLKLVMTNDILDIFGTFASKTYIDTDDDNNLFYNHSKDVSYNLNRKLQELNKNCEKLIDEQKKFINFYKNKKLRSSEINSGKDESKKGIKSGANTGKSSLTEEKFDMINFGLYSQNIKEMNNAIMNIINKKEVNSFTALNLV